MIEVTYMEAAVALQWWQLFVYYIEKTSCPLNITKHYKQRETVCNRIPGESVVSIV